MRVDKISRKLIKPHTPTPQTLQNYKLSFADMRQWPVNLAVVLFYESKPEEDRQLEESLAKILVEFYPLAGRYIKNDLCIDCSDEGVEFVVAEALDDVVLMELVAKTSDAEQFNDLLPDKYFRVDEAAHDPLLSIQATHFPCGGLTIAISVSHRVFDVSSLGTFISAWSNATNPDYKKVGLTNTITPSFDLPSLLPCKDEDVGGGVSKQSSTLENKKIVVKRLLFNKEALTRLRSNIINNGKTISRVRVVCAVIAKALISLDRAKHGRNRDIIILQSVNMRERTIPPQPKHACGNLSFASITRRVAASEAEEIGMEELVDVIGDATRKSIADHAEILSPNSDGRDIIVNNFENSIKEILINPETNVIIFSDWSKFGFNEADFGRGEPIWTSIGPQRSSSNATVLMSNKEGDGIEAWLHLSINDIPYFDQDEEVKLFTI